MENKFVITPSFLRKRGHVRKKKRSSVLFSSQHLKFDRPYVILGAESKIFLRRLRKLGLIISQLKSFHFLNECDPLIKKHVCEKALLCSTELWEQKFV